MYNNPAGLESPQHLSKFNFKIMEGVGWWVLRWLLANLRESTKIFILILFSSRWESEGAKGWSYEDCLPYFKKAQVRFSHPMPMLLKISE